MVHRILLLTVLFSVAYVLQSCDSATDVPANREVENIITNTTNLISATTPIHFGKANPGTVQKITLTNTEATNTIEVQTITLDNGNTGYTLVNLPTLPLRIKPNATISFDVKLDTRVRGVVTDRIILNGYQTTALEVYGESTVTDAPVSDNIYLLKVSATNVSFGTKSIGENGTVAVSFENASADSSVTIDNVKFTDASNGLITMQTSLQFPLVLLPNQKREINFVYTPNAYGKHQATAQLVSPKGQTVDITLTGNCVDTAAQVPIVESFDLTDVTTKPKTSITFTQKFINQTNHQVLINNITYRYTSNGGATWTNAPSALCSVNKNLNQNMLQTPVEAGQSHAINVVYSAMGRILPSGSYIFEATVNYVDPTLSITKDAKGQVTVTVP